MSGFVVTYEARKRFWAKIDKNGPAPGHDTLAAGKGLCWLWAGKPDPDGYGHITTENREGQRKTPTIHRFSYQLHGGVLVDGMNIDHLCRNRICSNPEHLEQVTVLENIARGDAGHNRRKTHCLRGHEYTEENTYRHPLSWGRGIARRCVECNRELMRERGRAERAGKTYSRKKEMP